MCDTPETSMKEKCVWHVVPFHRHNRTVHLCKYLFKPFTFMSAKQGGNPEQTTLKKTCRCACHLPSRCGWMPVYRLHIFSLCVLELIHWQVQILTVNVFCANLGSNLLWSQLNKPAPFLTLRYDDAACGYSGFADEVQPCTFTFPLQYALGLSWLYLKPPPKGQHAFILNFQGSRSAFPIVPMEALSWVESIALEILEKKIYRSITQVEKVMFTCSMNHLMCRFNCSGRPVGMLKTQFEGKI